jgi:glutathione S-transferase
MNNLVVKYFPVRGRCEPVLLKLADANIPFVEEIISLNEWVDMKKSGKTGPPDFPSLSVPVLSFTDRDGERINLAETNAILFFLDRVYPGNKCNTVGLFFPLS